MTEENKTAIIQINPLGDMDVLKMVTESNIIRDYAEARHIIGSGDVRSATEDLSMMANLKKALVAKQTEYVKPIKGYLTVVTDIFKTILTPIEEADRITRQKILVYRAAEQSKAAEVERINNLRIEAARAEAKLNGTGEITESVNLIPDVAAPARKVETDVGNLGTMKVWKFEVVDSALVPRDYLEVDLVKIGQVVRATKGTISIPGIRVWSEDTLTVMAK